jgi:hypothetical protein
MGRVNRRRALLVVILVYVALDLSLPTMPGAFVFDPADSLESIQTARGRTTARVVVLPSPVRHEFLTSQPQTDLRQRQLPSEVTAFGQPSVSCLPQARCESARPSEDPH